MEEAQRLAEMSCGDDNPYRAGVQAIAEALLEAEARGAAAERARCADVAHAHLKPDQDCWDGGAYNRACEEIAKAIERGEG